MRTTPTIVSCVDSFINRDGLVVEWRQNVREASTKIILDILNGDKACRCRVHVVLVSLNWAVPPLGK